MRDMANIPQLPPNTIGLFDNDGISFATIIAQAEEFEEISGLYRNIGNDEKAERYQLLSQRFRKIAEVFGQSTQVREGSADE